MDEANNLSSSSSVSSLSSTSSTSSSSSLLGILRRTRKRSYIPENPFNISKIPKLNIDNEDISIPSSLNIPTPIEKWRNESAIMLNSSSTDQSSLGSTNNKYENDKMVEDKLYSSEKLNNNDSNKYFNDVSSDKKINNEMKRNNIPGLQYTSDKSDKKKDGEGDDEYELEDGEVQEDGEINENSDNENTNTTSKTEDSIIPISSNDKICIDNIVNEGEINPYIIKLKEYIEFRNACSLEIRKFGKGNFVFIYLFIYHSIYSLLNNCYIY